MQLGVGARVLALELVEDLERLARGFHRSDRRPAFALPVRWERADGPAGGPDLPPELDAEAGRVLELVDAFRSDGSRAAGRWRLRLAVDDHPDRYDLSGWRCVGGGSWWGSLTAGWMVAARGGLPDPTVWASVGVTLPLWKSPWHTMPTLLSLALVACQERSQR